MFNVASAALFLCCGFAHVTSLQTDNHLLNPNLLVFFFQE